MVLFIGREKELEWLEGEYKTKIPSFVVLYGRRRIGKTSLVAKFLKERNSLYYLADESPPKEQLTEFSRGISRWYGSAVRFDSWYNAFEFLSKVKKRKKLAIAIDEFPYLLSSDGAIISKFQKIWDELLSKQNVMLILLGSSVSVMENEVLAKKSPLYGRRTSQIELKPFSISGLMTFFGKDMENALLKYGISDGIPAYAEKIKRTKFPECLNEVLSPNKFLYGEASFLLKSEFRETPVYREILYAIANGRNMFGEIAQFSEVSGQKLPQYLKNLASARLIKKDFPVTSKKEFRGARYVIEDNYFNFWFRFVRPNKESIEYGRSKEVFDAVVKDYNHYMGRIFEKAILLMVDKFIPFNFTNAGRWWHKNEEIDVVTFDRNTRKILFAECKWSEKVDAENVLRELRRKAKLVDWHKEKREEYYAVFAKSFKKKIKEENVLLFDLKDMEKIFRQRIK